MREAIILGIIIGLFFAAIGAVLAALAIKNATPSALWDWILWLGISSIALSILLLVLYIYSAKNDGPFVLPAVLFAIGIYGLTSGLGIALSPQKPNGAPTDITSGPSIFLQCFAANLPAVSPPGGVFWVIQLQGRAGVAAIGFAQMYGEPGRETGLELANLGQLYRCDVTNYGSQPVTDVALMLRLTFSKAVKEGNAYHGTSDIVTLSRTLQTQKIDPGKDNPFSFYIWNMSNEFVELEFGSQSTLRIIGELKDRVITIEQANPAPVLHFIPRSGSLP
jgi:hypothetical protein